MFAAHLRETMANRPSALAIQTESVSLTYGDLARKAQSVGAALRRAGLQKGDRVALYLEDKLGLLVSHVGIILAGGVSLPLSPAFTRFEMAYFLRDSGAQLAVATGSQAAILEGLRAETATLKAVLDPQALTEAAPDRATPDVGPKDPAMLMYSSGTTGEPKGAIHTHHNLACALLALQKCWRFTTDDTLLITLPLCHIHGLSFGCHLALLTGCRILLADSFHPIKTLDLIGKATVFYGIPSYYYAFMERQEFPMAAKNWSGVRLFTCGSAPIRPETLPQLEEILGQPLINRYGMTESHVITSLPLDGAKKQGSVGLPLDGVEVKLIDNDGRTPAAGAVGEVLIRGENLFKGYLGKPELTRAAFDAEGWFATGDLGFLDGNGYLTLRGRKKDLIIVSGYNVYPPVVERAINSCPGVKESAVVGCPDPRKGERVVAFVVSDGAKLTEADVKRFCAERMIDYERPWKVIFLDALPRNTMGKVLKTELRKMAER